MSEWESLLTPISHPLADPFPGPRRGLEFSWSLQTTSSTKIGYLRGQNTLSGQILNRSAAVPDRSLAKIRPKVSQKWSQKWPILTQKIINFSKTKFLIALGLMTVSRPDTESFLAHFCPINQKWPKNSLPEGADLSHWDLPLPSLGRSWPKNLTKFTDFEKIEKIGLAKFDLRPNPGQIRHKLMSGFKVKFRKTILCFA